MASLAPFEGPATKVAAWVTSREEGLRWAGVTAWPVPDLLFAEWHADPDVVPFELVEGDELLAYGELWQDEGEAELARLLVDPARRGQGVGRRLVRALVDEARRRGFEDVWLRVRPDNAPAIRCYAASGFVRASADDEAAFNVGQPCEYVWMRAGEA